METIERVASNELLVDKPLAISASETLRAYVDLTKPRITLMVVLTTIAGFCLASSQGLEWLKLVHLIVGIAVLSSGISTLNQWMERDLDALMLRTRNRPLPTGKLTATQALIFGLSFTISSIAYLIIFINSLTALLGVITAASYLLLYTPLKTKTTLSTVCVSWGDAASGRLGCGARQPEH
jgi:heme o synthase